MIDAEPEFKKAKAFSDFIAFHVRIQFIFIIAFLVAAPVIVDLNGALRDNTSFSSTAGFVDKIAIVVLLLSAFWMCYLALKVVWRFVGSLILYREDASRTRRTIAFTWRITLFCIFASIDVLVMAAVFWTGAERVSPLLGLQIEEVPFLLDELGRRGCVFGSSGCD